LPPRIGQIAGKDPRGARSTRRNPPSEPLVEQPQSKEGGMNVNDAKDIAVIVTAAGTATGIVFRSLAKLVREIRRK
jgi:hypothetical protein